MQDKNNKKVIWFGLIVSIFFFLIFIFTKDLGQNTTNRQGLLEQVLPGAIETDQAFLEINEKKIGTKIIKNENIYDFMQELQKERKINFKDTTYIGMGKLIEEINGIKNSGERNWIYYVNDVEAQVGVSNYKLKVGDVVSWKYEQTNH